MAARLGWAVDDSQHVRITEKVPPPPPPPGEGTLRVCSEEAYNICCGMEQSPAGVWFVYRRYETRPLSCSTVSIQETGESKHVGAGGCISFPLTAGKRYHWDLVFPTGYYRLWEAQRGRKVTSYSSYADIVKDRTHGYTIDAVSEANFELAYKFKCCKCGLVFDTESKFKEHWLANHVSGE